MTPKEQKLIEKLKELIDDMKALISSDDAIALNLDARLSDLSALEQETKGERLTDEEIFAVMADALYATGRFTTDQCDNLIDGVLNYLHDVEGVLSYLHDAGYRIVPQSPELREEKFIYWLINRDDPTNVFQTKNGRIFCDTLDGPLSVQQIYDYYKEFVLPYLNSKSEK